ncbi:HAD family hydrolase [Citricoccus muralis]|uniref:HAD family hydrolase n=1 Tax=Citricoccus muralis TaxID=169134 RepID=A0ABY8HAR9_9MICC|nr:HAD family hydrolase [Citricoccus muralis]WFP17733.1 HAD family hydrolase [Citricoccus muralis]
MIRGVLFDIDDTLIDLASAQTVTFQETIARQTGQDLMSFDPATLAEATRYFARDLDGHYDRYVAGELDFLGQRLARVRGAMDVLGRNTAPDEQLWGETYERNVRARWALFEDVAPTLTWLDEHGVPYGAVSNNVEHYQRGKLAEVGLSWDIVVGTDTAGAPKPDPAPFLEGCRLLNCAPNDVMMVGDNPIADGQGAREAGLTSVLVERPQPKSLRAAASVSAVSATAAGDRLDYATAPPGVHRITDLREIRCFVIGAETRV